LLRNCSARLLCALPTTATLSMILSIVLWLVEINQTSGFHADCSENLVQYFHKPALVQAEGMLWTRSSLREISNNIRRKKRRGSWLLLRKWGVQTLKSTGIGYAGSFETEKTQGADKAQSRWLYAASSCELREEDKIASLTCRARLQPVWCLTHKPAGVRLCKSQAGLFYPPLSAPQEPCCHRAHPRLCLICFLASFPFSNSLHTQMPVWFQRLHSPLSQQIAMNLSLFPRILLDICRGVLRFITSLLPSPAQLWKYCTDSSRAVSVESWSLFICHWTRNDTQIILRSQ